VHRIHFAMINPDLSNLEVCV